MLLFPIYSLMYNGPLFVLCLSGGDLLNSRIANLGEGFDSGYGKVNLPKDLGRL